MIEITILIGFIGLALGLCVNPLQIIKILKTKNVNGISKGTYYTLTGVMICYLVRAIAINELVFIISNALGIISCTITLILLYKYGDKKWSKE